MVELPTGTVTFLFTDIEGSTRLWEAHPAAMPEMIARHDALLRQTIEAHAGVVFKLVGDAVYAAFARPADALRATTAGQQLVETTDWGEVGPIRVRMALHAGTVEVHEGDYHGQPLNRVARLLSAGHGGQVLLSGVVADMVRDTLPAGTRLESLGEHRLKDLQQPERISQLVIDGLPDAFPPLKTLDYRPNNLPVQPTRLIGRERELAAAVELAQHDSLRLATIMGPGGIGKTRLSLQAAADLIERFEDGVFFVPLAAITEPALVPSAIAQALALREVGGQPVLETLTTYLAAKQLLLVLDNFEQVIAAAPVVATLLAGCPRLKVIATSRSPLQVRGERIFPIDPLALPEPGQRVTAEAIADCSAVQLFVERAAAARPNFELTDANAATIAEICRQLDGLPLALELAAARVKVLAPEALLARLSRRIPLLTGGARDLPERHQTLRATIAWSYDLLDPEAQQLHRRLAVFAGGFTLEAAEAVVPDNPDDAFLVLDGLGALVDQSLLRSSETEDGLRFTMLETIREYGLEQLEAAGETDTLRQRHARHFVALAEEAAPHLMAHRQLEWLDRLDREHDNLRLALRSCIEGHEVKPALQLGAALWPFWRQRGYLMEGRAQLAQLLELPADELPGPRARVLTAAASLASTQADYGTATTLAQAAVELFANTDDRRGAPWLWLTLGDAAFRTGDREAAAAHWARAGELARELHDHGAEVHAHITSGLIDLVAGRVEEAKQQLAEALALARRRGDLTGSARALGNLGLIAMRQGDTTTGAAYFQDAFEIGRSLRDRHLMVLAQLNLGHHEVDLGNHARGIERYQDTLRLCQELGDWFSAISCLEEIGFSAGAIGQAELGAKLLGAASALREAYDIPMMEVEVEEHEPRLAAVRERLGETAFQGQWGQGRTLTMDAAIDLALTPRPVQQPTTRLTRLIAL